MPCPRRNTHAGVPDMAKALWMSREDIKVPELLDYVQHFQLAFCGGGLGFLPELYAMALREQLAHTTFERNALEGRMIGRTEELVREMEHLRQELEKERKEKGEAREKAAELWGRLSQIQSLERENEEGGPRKPQRNGKA